MDKEEWNSERQKNDGHGKQGTGSKAQNQANHPGGDKHKNEAPPKGNQIDDGGKYES
jgi:hypothetical protein